MRFMLVHSPLVGPTTRQWVAKALQSSGHDVAVPDLRGAATTGAPRAVVRAALQLTGKEPTVLVGHRWRRILPALDRCRPRLTSARLVFVDAGVPPCEGEATTSAEFLEHLRSLAPDGTLPKWST